MTSIYNKNNLNVKKLDTEVFSIIILRKQYFVCSAKVFIVNFKPLSSLWLFQETTVTLQVPLRPKVLKAKSINEIGP